MAGPGGTRDGTSDTGLSIGVVVTVPGLNPSSGIVCHGFCEVYRAPNPIAQRWIGRRGGTGSEAFGITLPASRVRLMRPVVDSIQTIQLIRGDFDRQQTRDVDLFYCGLRKI
jgi:hypothetical protein